MNAANFQLNKVRRLLKTQGQNFRFSRPQTNEFGEPHGILTTKTIRGIFHETTSYISRTTKDSATLRKKPSPMILCLWEEADRLAIQDVLKFNSKTYTVSGIENVSMSNLVGEVSLEEVQHG